MKLLLYGFGPYKDFRTNISEEVIKQLPERKEVETHIFPVRFDKETFLQKIISANPDLIVGLGQASTGENIRTENRAINVFKDNKRDKGEEIDASGPQERKTTLRIPEQELITQSDNAGTYVCNFSMYVIGELAEDHNIPYTFIHIPYQYNLRKAVAIIDSILDNVLGSI